jgi:Domain of unknown function (DUF1963)
VNTADSNFEASSIAELLDCFAATVVEVEAATHTARRSRLVAKRRRIIKAIEAKDGGVARILRPLLSHADPRVRLAAACELRACDHAQYQATVLELAKRSDAIASAAKAALEWDEYLKNHPPSAESGPRIPRSDSRLSGNKPLAGMTRDELKPLLSDAFPRATATALMKLARPAIRVWPQPLPADAASTASRFGGLPAVGRNWAWPTTELWDSSDREPLWFLAQINCRDLVDFDCASFLPDVGVLSFFGDGDFVTGGDGSSVDGAIHYWGSEGALSTAAAPGEDFNVLPSCGLGFAPAIELPDPLSRAIEKLALDESLKSRYWDIRAAVNTHGIPAEVSSEIDRSKLFGWPDLVQRELDSFCEKGIKNPRLFLQIGNYDNGRESRSWGPGGLVYFVIGEAALKAARLEEGCIEMQCT